ncbi:MAG: P-type conjugative transfer protein TrbL [Sulfuricurvum sp.]
MKHLILLLLIPAFLFGGVDPTNQAHSLLSPFMSASAHWRETIVPYAMYVFWALTTIDFVLEFGLIAAGGKVDWSDFIPLLIRKTLMIGFFLMLFQYSHWLASIPESFAQIGNTAAGVSVSPDNVLNNGIAIIEKIWEGISVLDIGDSIMLALCGVVMLIAFGLMAAQLFMNYVKTYALLALAPLVFALAGLSQTRQIAVNPILAVIKAGMELLLLELYMGLAITKLTEYAANVDTDTNSVLAMAVTTVLIASVVHMVPGIVESLMSGTLGSNSTAGIGTFQSVAAGAVGGAIGAGKGAAGFGAAVKAASSLAKEQRAAGDSTASTFKNLKSAFANDVKRSMAGENTGGTVGGRMAFRYSAAPGMQAQSKASGAVENTSKQQRDEQIFMHNQGD